MADFGVGGLVAAARKTTRHTQAKEALVGVFLAEHDANGSTQDGKYHQQNDQGILGLG